MKWECNIKKTLRGNDLLEWQVEGTWSALRSVERDGTGSESWQIDLLLVPQRVHEFRCINQNLHSRTYLWINNLSNAVLYRPLLEMILIY